MTDTQIIEFLGGTMKLARALNISFKTTSAWKRRGISRAGRYQIRDLARRKRIKLPDGFMESING